MQRNMNKINRMMTNICSDDLAESRVFYTTLFDFKVDYDSDWFVHLVSKDKQLELGIIKRTSEIVPDAFQNKPQGFYLTFVVDDIDELFAQTKKAGFVVLKDPHDTTYGQRRLLISDPNGTLVDISSPMSNFGS